MIFYLIQINNVLKSYSLFFLKELIKSVIEKIKVISIKDFNINENLIKSIIIKRTIFIQNIFHNITEIWDIGIEFYI